MFQVGFGMNAFKSGLLTLSVFAGNLSMKLVTTQVMRRFGFRRVLVVNGLIAAISLAVMSLISPTTPLIFIVIVLFASGLSRSLQFTALNTLSFADVPKPQMSAASALSSTLFQLTMGFGVALGAIALRLSEAIHGHSARGIAPEDFQVAFLIVAVVGLVGVADLFTLHRDARRGSQRAREAVKQCLDEASDVEAVDVGETPGGQALVARRSRSVMRMESRITPTCASCHSAVPTTQSSGFNFPWAVRITSMLSSNARDPLSRRRLGWLDEFGMGWVINSISADGGRT